MLPSIGFTFTAWLWTGGFETGTWGLPGGYLELGEIIFDEICRVFAPFLTIAGFNNH
jgi:hypothetical protein